MTEAIQRGFNLAGDFMNLVDEAGSSRSFAAAAAEEKAKMLEIDARGNALDARQRANEDARLVRSDAEELRARQNADWGQSGLAMSGSKKLVRETGRIKDHQTEEDVLFKGRMESEETINQGRHKANLLRIGNKAAPVRSSLSLGSGIYGPRR